jgi:GGDEF domain-containing protein
MFSGAVFVELLERELAASRRYGTFLALVILRVSGSEDVLRASVRTLRARVRSSDLVARTGPCEIAVVLLRADRGRAEVVAARLLALLGRHGILAGARVAVAPPWPISAEELRNRSESLPGLSRSLS